MSPAAHQATRKEQKATIRRIGERDLVEMAGIFYQVMDEIHKDKPPEVRTRFRESFRFRDMEMLIPKKYSVLRGAFLDNRMVGFVMGFVNREKIGWIPWLCIGRSCRRRGIGSQLLSHAIRDFRAKGAYEIAAFTYPEHTCVVDLFRSKGFQEKCEIEKTFFSTHVLYMVKDLKRGRRRERLRTIRIVGRAGQGINRLAQILGKMLVAVGKYVSLDVVYPPSVRSGVVRAEILFSDYPIMVPFIDRPDVLVLLCEPPADMEVKAGKIIAEEVPEFTDPVRPESQRLPFSRKAEEEFRSPLFINMIALGRILGYLGFPLEVLRFEDSLPASFRRDPEYVKAIKYGYSFRDFYL